MTNPEYEKRQWEKARIRTQLDIENLIEMGGTLSFGNFKIEYIPESTPEDRGEFVIVNVSTGDVMRHFGYNFPSTVYTLMKLLDTRDDIPF